MTEVVTGANCKKCGAPLELQPGEVIITCQYCGSSFNQATDKSFVLKHSIIPNGLDEKETLDLVRAWMRGGTKPPTLAKGAKIEEVQLTYLPFFVVEVKATTEFKGGMTRTGGWVPREGTMEREYFWTVLARRGTNFPTREYDVPVEAKTPFDLSKVPGFAKILHAEMDGEEAVLVARQEIEENQKFLLSDDIDSIDKLSTTMDVGEVEFVHAPIWNVRFKFHDKEYQIIIDGGKRQVIRGDVPPPDESLKGFMGTLRRGLFGD